MIKAIAGRSSIMRSTAQRTVGVLSNHIPTCQSPITAIFVLPKRLEDLQWLQLVIRDRVGKVQLSPKLEWQQ
ncbi:MAG: hypothetical protein HC939_19535 [Pleurocapsa sp. SU_5_0]|nr:hypothetical protein [Pleurocapsa sp. SU_5_0]NJO95602.1 hypothetical protein [Pleurocapsa sp. CRU_1_2]NJR47446.1 hypothetical protein [Hyellaceae cyanobacterium CSU_1_1]